MRLGSTCVVIILSAGCADAAHADTEATVSSDEEYQNPVDGKTYVAPGGWQTYYPQSPRPDDPNGRVSLESVRLLTPQAEMAARTTAPELTAFIREAERLADESFGASDKAFRVIVQFTCKSYGHEVKLAQQGDATQELLQGYYDALMAMRPLRVSDGALSFQLEVAIKP